MTQITKHYTKQEWERHASKDCWIDFLIHGNTIGVDNFLESPCEFIRLNVSWWLNGMVIEPFEVSSRVLLKYISNFAFFCDWTPEETNIGTSTSLHVVE